MYPYYKKNYNAGYELVRFQRGKGIIRKQAPVGEHTGSPTQVGACIEDGIVNQSLNAHELGKP